MPKPKRKTSKGKKYQKRLSLYGQDESEVLAKLLSTPSQKQVQTAKKEKAK
jgi:hypothetical protein